VLNGYEGRLYAYDKSFRRSAGEDRIFTLGLQVSVFALGWNFETNEFLVLSPAGGHVYSVSADLQTSRRLFDVPVTNEVPNPASITYMGNNEIGVVNAGPPRGIDFAELISSDPNIPNGTSHQRLIWSPADGFPPDGPFNPRGFGMLDSNTIVFRAIGDTSALKVVTRSGRADSSIYRDGVVPDRLPDIVLSSPTDALGVQVFDNGSGPRIFTGAEVYKIDGTLVHRVDWRRLGLSKPARGGVWIGGNTFAALDGLTSTVVIFSMQ
jgi:hypothetical protein